MILGRKNKTLKDIVSILKVYHDNIDEDEIRAENDTAPTPREILEGLIAYLDGC